jgi:hypothetical protein
MRLLKKTILMTRLGMADEIAGGEEGRRNRRSADGNDAAERAAPLEPFHEEEEDEDIDLTEEMLSDLIEELVVDMTPRPQGWSSVNSADNSIEQANNDAMAAAQAAHLKKKMKSKRKYQQPLMLYPADFMRPRFPNLQNLTESFVLLLWKPRISLQS